MSSPFFLPLDGPRIQSYPHVCEANSAIKTSLESAESNCRSFARFWIGNYITVRYVMIDAEFHSEAAIEISFQPKRQKIQLPTQFFEILRRRKSFHTFDRDGSCADKISRIGAGVGVVYVMQCIRVRPRSSEQMVMSCCEHVAAFVITIDFA